MTPAKYYLYSILKAFGANITKKCLTEATHEMHLFKDAQELIGHYNYEYIEGIDDLKTEYWEIQNIMKKMGELDEKEYEIEDELINALEEKDEAGEKLVDEREAIEEEINDLIIEREKYIDRRAGIFHEGKRTRKVYDGLKAKIEFFEKEDETPEKKETLEQLEECVAKLQVLKAERDAVVQDIEKIESEIDALEDKLNSYNKEVDDDTLSTSSQVGEKNKELTKIRSERSALQAQLDKNTRYVGRYLFTNRKERAVKKCIKTHREIVRQAVALRKSLILNHKLANSRIELREG